MGCDNIPSSASDFNLQIYVRDCTVLGTCRNFSFQLPSSIHVDSLLHKVADKVNLKAEQIWLGYTGEDQSGSSEIALNENLQFSLAEVLRNVTTICPDGKLYFIATLADEASLNNSRSKIDSDLSSIEFSPQHNSGLDSPSSPLPTIAESISLPEPSPYLREQTAVVSSVDNDNGHEEPSAKRFVGLVNQAMTCYLNSLIQTLFMTPEFRNAIYSWDPSELPDESSKSRSIPYQLQRLFLRLQFSSRQAVETTELTTSFGWDTSEAWEQHDVQELCRILFDALEAAWKGTDKSDLIDRLYQGKMEDYVQCLACNNCSSRVAKYQDISLAIRSFDAQVSYKTLHEALSAFTKPEILSDDNKYFCEKCCEKQDAKKGLRFQSFPRIVTMQLKRFDFDYRFGNRVKLSDRIFFPLFINLDCYIAHRNNPEVECAQYPRVNGTQDRTNGDIEETGSCNENSDYDIVECDDPDDESISSRYELFSVLVHSGSASGGHYYAYIKNFEDGCFYSFNDRVVRYVDDEEIRLTFGSGNGTASAYSYSTSGYMLMYRLIDKNHGQKNFLTANEMHNFPWLLQQINEIKGDTESTLDTFTKGSKFEDISMASSSQATVASYANETDSSHLAVTVFYVHPDDCIVTPSRVRLPRTCTLQEAADIVVKELNIEKFFKDLDKKFRLVRYNSNAKLIGLLEVDRNDDNQPSSSKPVDCYNDNVPISEFSNSNSSFFLEVLPKNMEFRVFTDNCVTVTANLVDSENMKGVVKSAMTALPTSWKLADIAAYICELLSLPTPYLRMAVVERFWPNDGNVIHLFRMDSTLENAKLTESPVDIFVENLSEPEDPLFPFRRTPLYRFLDFQINTAFLAVNLSFDKQDVPIVCFDSLDNITVLSSMLDRSLLSYQPIFTTFISNYCLKCQFSTTEDGNNIVASLKVDKRLQIFNIAEALANNTGFNPKSTVIWRDIGGHFEEQLDPEQFIELIATSSRLSLRAGIFPTENQMIINIHEMEDSEKRLSKSSIHRFFAIVEKDWTILKIKELITSYLTKAFEVNNCCVGNLTESNKCSHCGNENSNYHLRLRRNRFSEPSRILAASEVIGDCQMSNIKIIFFELRNEGPEVKQLMGDIVVKARLWNPSEIKLDDPVEICVSTRGSPELLSKLSTRFDIAFENIEVASCSSSTTSVSLLDMQDHIRWKDLSSIKEIEEYPLMLHEDGAMFYVRDKSKPMADIGEEKRREIINTESSSRSKSNGVISGSFHSILSNSLRERVSRPREKSLKIYTHQSSPSPSKSHSETTSSVPSRPVTTPTGQLQDLDSVSSIEVDSPPQALDVD